MRHLILFLKGTAMGAADVVPGVSGGTIAFISGIYEELLDSIRSIDLRALRLLFTAGPGACWRAINGNFLLAVFAGIITSIFSLARLISYGLNHYPLLVWSFFFGLIVASVIYIVQQQRNWHAPSWTGLLAGLAAALAIAHSPPLQMGTGLESVLFAGMLAICAMILPGISGSFILLLLGMYPTIIDAVTGFDGKVLAVFALGCAIGLLAFSRLLSWLLHRYHSVTLATLTGFLTGSLVMVWPWKEVLSTIPGRHGEQIIVSQRLLLPADYGQRVADPQLLQGVLLMLCGIVLVLGLEYLGNRRA